MCSIPNKPSNLPAWIRRGFTAAPIASALTRSPRRDDRASTSYPSARIRSDVLNTEQAIQFTRVDPQRVYSRTYSKRINEVASPRRSGEHELPIGQDQIGCAQYRTSHPIYPRGSAEGLQPHL